jgi:NAD(P)H dehydrogenase (quinone)
MTIAITGASGTMGRLVAEAVLAAADPSDVVVISRNPSKLDDFAQRGAQTRHGDFNDRGTLPAAFAGVDRLLIISTDVVGQRLGGHFAAVDAAAEAGVGHLVYTSMIDPSDSNPIAVADEHRPTEERIRTSGADWTFLRNSIYAEMLAGSAHAALATGRHVTNAGAGATSYVARADCAAVAAAVLTTDGHAGRAYDVTGAQALTADDEAALFTVLGDRAVRVAHVDDEAWIAGLVEHAGMPEAVARMLSTFGVGARMGYADSVSTTVRQLLDREPIAAREALASALS